MTDSDAFSYRVKFKDIRVNPPAADKSRAKAKQTRGCDKSGCDLAGEHPAPKQGMPGRWWFCQTHAAEYNREFNFFEGMTEAEAAAFAEAERHGHKRTWKFGTGPMSGKRSGSAAHDPSRWAGRGFFDLGSAETEAKAHVSPLIKRSLEELDLEPDAKPAEVRARYADYVRRFHPDSNQGDRSSEHKLERVLRAGKLLKAAGRMKG